MGLDYSILGSLGLPLPPIGIKYDFFKPEGVQPLEEDVAMSLCELLRESQRRDKPFYFSRQSKETCVGKNILGMDNFEPFARSGQIGKGLGVFNEPRCNGELYQHVNCLDFGTVNYVTFAQYYNIDFNPDVLIVAAPPNKAEIVLRAGTYSTGMLYTSTCTPVIGCSWLFAYPFRSGKVNFVLPAVVHGLHGRELYDENTVLISIPYQWIPTVINNLCEMEHHLKGHESVDAYHEDFGGIVKSLAERSKEQ